jgi:ABC-type transport system substrate-binding protein
LKTVDVGKRKALLERFQRIVDEEAPLLYLVHPHALSAVLPKLKNAAPGNHRPRVYWNIDQLEGVR